MEEGARDRELLTPFELSPGGRAAFDEAVAKYAQDLIAEIARQEGSSPATGEAQASSYEVVLAVTRLRGASTVLGARIQRRQIRFLALGLFYIVLGAAGSVAANLAATQDWASGQNLPSVLGLTAAGVTLSGSLIVLYGFRRVQRNTDARELLDSSPAGAALEFLAEWQGFERELRSLRPSGPVDLNKYTLSQSIVRAQSMGVLSAEDVVDVRRLLNLRNLLVHSDVRQSKAVLEAGTRDLLRLRRSLSLPIG